MLKKILQALSLIVIAAPSAADELTNLVDSSQAIRDSFKIGIQAIGGMWDLHESGAIANSGIVDPGMITDAKQQAYNNAVLQFKDALYTWDPNADQYFQDQANQASADLSAAIDDFVQASAAVITVVEVNERAQEAAAAPDARESIALQEYMDQNDVLLDDIEVDGYNEALQSVEVAAQTAAAYMAVANDEGLLAEANDAAYAMNVTFEEAAESFFDAATGTLTVDWLDQELAVNLLLNDYFMSDADIISTGAESYFFISSPEGGCWFLEGAEREACLNGA